MNLTRKREIVQDALTSIAEHSSEDTPVVIAVLEACQADAKAKIDELNAAMATRTGEVLGAAPEA